jgi:hypothetical protein
MQPVEDYTTPFLAMVWLILFMGFLTMAVVVGFIWVAFSAWLIHRGITRLALRNNG